VESKRTKDTRNTSRLRSGKLCGVREAPYQLSHNGLDGFCTRPYDENLGHKHTECTYIRFAPEELSTVGLTPLEKNSAER